MMNIISRFATQFLDCIYRFSFIIVTMNCYFPPSTSDCELQTIYTTLVSTHFFTPETSGPTPAAVQLGLSSDDKVPGGVKFDEGQLRKVVTSMVKVTVELSDRMREMFLPTAQRCHYLFTPRDLGTIFRWDAVEMWFWILIFYSVDWEMRLFCHFISVADVDKWVVVVVSNYVHYLPHLQKFNDRARHSL